MKKILTITVNWLRLLRIRFQLRPSRKNKAVKEAVRMHKKNGKRYRVFFFGGEYRIWTREDIKRQMHDGLLKYNKKPGVDYDGICFFDTNSLDKEGGKL